MKKVLVLGLALFSFVFESVALGWGQYGHEQITHAAVLLVKDTPFGACLNRNIDYLTRLSISPDSEWKLSSQDSSRIKNLKAKKKRTEAEESELKRLLFVQQKVNSVEHTNHFFQIDSFAYAPNSEVTQAQLSQLPTNPVFAESLEVFAKLLQPNVERLNKLTTNAAKKIGNPISTKDIVEQGTAHYRIYQLMELARKELSQERPDLKLALMYLGTASHYVGDMAQPFHTTSLYNTPRGIHSDYESRFLEQFAREAGFKKDNATQLWQLEGTEAEILKLANKALGGRIEPIANDSVLKEIYEISASGVRFVAPLQRAYSENMKKSHQAEVEKPLFEVNLLQAAPPIDTTASGLAADDLKRFSEEELTVKLADGNFKGTVFESAMERMALGSAMLAKQWVALGDEVKISDPKDCPEIDFDESYVQWHYAPPTYIPGLESLKDDDGGKGEDEGV